MLWSVVLREVGKRVVQVGNFRVGVYHVYDAVVIKYGIGKTFFSFTGRSFPVMPRASVRSATGILRGTVAVSDEISYMERNTCSLGGAGWGRRYRTSG